VTRAALVLAGGAGARMRRSRGDERPKPLVEVRGASLLERNLCALVGAGFDAIWVAHGEVQRAIAAATASFAERAHRRGVTVEALVEAAPLGTIGAAGLLRGRVEALVTVNADNLCALDLGALAARHAATGADLTLASHRHAWRLPYGELLVDGDRVAGYREKPAHLSRIASAICALGPAAIDAIDGPTGLPALAERLLAAGRDVRAFDHDAAWIDVNDAADADRADALVAATPALEQWAPRPDVEVVGAVLRDGDRLLLERRFDTSPAGLWDTPGGKLEPGETPAAALVRELREELGLVLADAGPEIACFDTLEPGGTILRHHVFARAVRAADTRACEGQILEWFARGALPPERARVVARSLAALDAGEA